VWANRGGGKTMLGALATLLDVVFKPGIEVRLLGGSMEQSRRMHAHLTRFLAKPVFDGLINGRITDKRVRLTNGSEVELLAQSQASVRGTRVHKLRCDEVDLFDADVWEAAQLVTRSATLGAFSVRGSVECLSTMHMPHGVMHKLVSEAKDGTRALFRWGVMDVLARCGPEHDCEKGKISLPQAQGAPGRKPGRCILWKDCEGRAKEVADGHLRVDDAIAMKRRVAVSTWRCEMLCERPKRTDCVLPEFDWATHVVPELPFSPESGGVRWLGGVDFGYRAPTVVLWAALDRHDVLWIVDERVEKGVILDEHITAIQRGLASAWPACEWLGVDPAGNSTNEQTGVSSVAKMRAAGLTVKTRRLGVSEGLALVRARLAPADGNGPRLFVHERCAKLIESLERYHYPANKPESDTPVKRDGFDHAVDALRYLVQNLDKPVKGINGGYV